MSSEATKNYHNVKQTQQLINKWQLKNKESSVHLRNA